ncbi:hypothetical protein DM01DRAFT_1381495 [Hesseltinella vesiculosa]|uniref:Lysophospholipase NTE1 n=1 Tax=Hesseltinella vesiculosa TaxID=101127 RepID=A0A1X2GPU3_9FUNG|nr:hypothetical protein DM01DRAFT_1381495 [Hesseltinella vesiculosa]
MDSQHADNITTAIQTMKTDTSVQASSSLLARVVGFVPSLLLRIAGFATITIPLSFYHILTWSFTVHLNFSSLVFGIALLLVGTYLVVRYRFLTKYSRLKSQSPQKQASSFDLHPDAGEDAGYFKPNIKNYPDEFLSAFLSSIKIFGYLEEPVFHELARHLQTKKLLAGDTLFRTPEQERSFYIVVDGHVQMFVKPDTAETSFDDPDHSDEDSIGDLSSDDGSDDSLSDAPPLASSSASLNNSKRWANHRSRRSNDKFKEYTLINEVGQGGTLSSLFTILSIFRESFNRSEQKSKARKRSMWQKIAHRSSHQHPSSLLTPEMQRTTSSADEWRHVFPNLENQTSDPLHNTSSNSSVANSDVLDQPSPTHQLAPQPQLRHRHASVGATTPVSPKFRIAKDAFDGEPLYNELNEITPPAVVPEAPLHPPNIMSPLTHRRPYRSVHPNIIARATVDTTLAVIPEEAFHKLSAKFPRAAAHIVQVILTRFQRVTLMTSHRYLGLTSELLQLEKLANDSVSERVDSPFCVLPGNDFPLDALDRLRNKFSSDGSSSPDTSASHSSQQASSKRESTATSPSDSTGPNVLQAMGILAASPSLRHHRHQMPALPSPSLVSGLLTPGNPSAIDTAAITSSTSTDLRHRHQRQQHYNSKVASTDDYSVDDDLLLRTSVTRCLSKALGIKPPTDLDSPSVAATTGAPLLSADATHPAFRRAPSSSQTTLPSWDGSSDTAYSRYMYPMDLFSHSGASTLDAATPAMSTVDTMKYEDDLDTLSVISSAHSGADSVLGGDRRHSSEYISPDEIMILYFPQGAMLIKEREQVNGLFFVIDGQVEASMTPAEGEQGNSPVLHPVDAADGSPAKAARKKKRRHRSYIFDRPAETVKQRLDAHQPESDPTLSPRAAPVSSGPALFSSRTTITNQTVASEAPAGRQSNREKATQGRKQQVKKPHFRVGPGGLIGYLDALTGHPSFVAVRAKTNTYVGFLPKKTLDRIIEKNPIVMMKLAKQLVDSLSPLLLHIDLSLEWMQVNAGQIICREGQPSESIYMVLHGRLRTIKEQKEGHLEILGEFGHGESVGELEVLTGAPTASTLHAIRDSELARMPKTLFNALSLRHPEVTLQISRMVAYRSLQLLMNKATPGQVPSTMGPTSTFHLDGIPASLSMTQNSELYGHNNVNLKTIGILPVNSMVPLNEFATNLKTALIHGVGASCKLLTSATITSVMGKHAFSRMGKLKIASWLAEQEERARIVLYLADSSVNSQWTRTCIRQADCILLVGLGDEDPAVGEYERFMINMKTTARKELVLLHRERSCIPGSTVNWLKNRLWIQAHHHVFMRYKQHTSSYTPNHLSRPPWLATQGRKMTNRSLLMLNKAKGQLEKYSSVVPTFGRLLEISKKRGSELTSVDTLTRNDFARLARRLCGKSVALVLGGGGARGVSHIGVIQALEEAGIPIDMIGGTSIGSFVGGLYARDMDLVSTIARSKLFAGRVSSIWRQMMDLTYPVTAWFTGHEFNRAIWKCLGDSQIEDFWLPYFAVTTNITFSRMEVHTTGYAWRYVRASMSLSGYMPPICDNGNMLVDGGYMDNLPVTVAKNMGADIVIAVDVASEDDTSPVYYGDSISGWWALLHSFNPFRTYNIPSIADIQSRLAYVSSVAKLEEAKRIDGTLYLKLPVQQWGTLEFDKFNDIKSLGYQIGKEVVGKWRKAGYASGRVNETDDQQRPMGKQVKAKRGRRNSV